MPVRVLLARGVELGAQGRNLLTELRVHGVRRYVLLADDRRRSVSELSADDAELRFGLLGFELRRLLFGLDRGDRVDVALRLGRQVGDAAADLICRERRLGRRHALLGLGQLLLEEADGGLGLLRDQVPFASHEHVRIGVRDARRGDRIRPGDTQAQDRGLGDRADDQVAQEARDARVQVQLRDHVLGNGRLLQKLRVGFGILAATRGEQSVEDRQLGIARAASLATAAACEAGDHLHFGRVLPMLQEREQQDRTDETAEHHQHQLAPADERRPKPTQVELAVGFFYAAWAAEHRSGRRRGNARIRT